VWKVEEIQYVEDTSLQLNFNFPTWWDLSDYLNPGEAFNSFFVEVNEVGYRTRISPWSLAVTSSDQAQLLNSRMSIQRLPTSDNSCVEQLGNVSYIVDWDSGESVTFLAFS
jgi:hypothetical protein